MGLAALWNKVAEAGSKKGPRHLGEGKQQECSAAKGINSPNSWPGKDKVNKTKAHRSQQRLRVVGASLLEDGAGVESYDVDYTMLDSLLIQDNAVTYFHTSAGRSSPFRMPP